MMMPKSSAPRLIFEQILLDRRDRLVDQHGPIVHSHRLDAGGQRTIDLRHFLVDGLGYRPTVLADQHEHCTQHDLLAVLRGGTGAQLPSDVNIGDVADANGLPLRRAHDDVAYIVERFDLSRGAYEVLLAAALDVAGADIAVVLVECAHQIRERQPVGSQPFQAGRNQVLLGVAANRIDFGHTGHVAQLRLDHPILNFPQVGGRVGCTVGLASAVFRFDGPQVDFPQPRGDWTHGGRDPAGQPFLGLLDPLVHQLAGEVDVRAVLEDHCHLGQAVPGQRARLLEPRQAGHHGLDGVGNPLLGLQRRIPGRRGIDLHLDVGDVRHRVDGKLPVVVDAERRHPEHGEDDEPTLLNGKPDDAFEHARLRVSAHARR
jgi:hypothetical protein